MPRKKAITGNWKMYKTVEEATHFVETLTPLVAGCQALVSLAVPFTALFPVAKMVKERGVPLAIGAQNMYDASEGAFTGEIAGKMLKEAGAAFVILGHSERRHLFHETSAFVNKKVKRALAEGLQPVLCIGETEEERSANTTEEVLRRQLLESLEGVREGDFSSITLAYEPVWAIGTGKNATPQDATAAHLFCREVVAERWGRAVAEGLVIQYGGSVKAENAAALLGANDVDGLLVGGASLDPLAFSKIVKCVER